MEIHDNIKLVLHLLVCVLYVFPPCCSFEVQELNQLVGEGDKLSVIRSVWSLSHQSQMFKTSCVGIKVSRISS